MSDSEEEGFCFYGNPLEPYDEDTIPKKRPISIEDQIATDEHGRRRFHGAFTGGFSAGFFNTVGSLEGWKPSEFRSSRQDKAQNEAQRPEDFMDEEDRGEFGIAPETVRATSDFATGKKRKKQVFTGGPIPGVPVLQTLIETGNETVGYILLKNIGLKHGGGNELSCAQDQRVYGCEMPAKYEISRSLPTSHIPKIYEDSLKNPKSNTFGMGYSGLEKSHINLFQSSGIVNREKNKKGFSISGQAFGVGAFEEEDDDIYTKEDMSNYDFELTSEKEKKKSVPIKNANFVFDVFVLSKEPLISKKSFPPPKIPADFIGKYKKKDSNLEITEPVKRSQLNSLVRSKYLGEDFNNVIFTKSKEQKNSKHDTVTKTEKGEDIRNIPLPSTTLANILGKNFSDRFTTGNKLNEDKESTNANLLADRFVSASQSDEHIKILEPVKRTENLHGTKEMREAARMKMFGPLTRVHLTWQPCSLLCRRFNVPEPKYNDMPKKDKKRTKHLIFEYQKHVEEESTHKPGLSIKQESVFDEEMCTEESANVSENGNLNEPSTSTDRIESQQTTMVMDGASENVNGQVKNTIDITEKVNIEKNMDLFKAVFLSSSESENESEEEKDKNEEQHADEQRNEIIKSNILGETLIPKIKPGKEGILSNIDFSKFSRNTKEKQTLDSENQHETLHKSPENQQVEGEVGKEINEIDDNVYGPKLPDRITISNLANVSHNYISSDEDNWVEKGSHAKKKSHKHKKKHKKEKHKKKHKKDKK